MGEIAIDTCNIPLNRLKSERSEIGKRAFQKDKPQGKLIWEYFMAGCKERDPQLYARLKAARKQRFASLAAIALCAWCSVSFLLADDEARRPRGMRRANRVTRSTRTQPTQLFKLAA